MAKWVRKAVADETQSREKASVQADQWAIDHPALWEYLTIDQHEDGSERTTSMLNVFCESGLVKVALQDREVGRSLWASAQGLPGALMALEMMLQSGQGEWRQSRQAGSKGKGSYRR